MPGKCEVYILNIRSVSPGDYQTLLSYMTPQTLERIQRFKFPEDKLRCALGEYFVKQTFARRYGLPYAEVEKRAGEKGKPYLKTDLAFQFNISHSGDYLVCAITDIPVGTDVQTMVPLEKGCAEKILSARELSEWETLKPREAAAYLIKQWTYKESYAKLKGLGLFLPFPAITVVPGGIVHAGGAFEACFFAEERLGDYYLVTSTSSPREIEYRRVGGLEEVRQKLPDPHEAVFLTASQLGIGSGISQV
ncbi:4'-phosphopantetheinyl transferase family protein [Desulfosporosinus shakirovi]|uniref:4'-phosphopantetheinyl transferase family protein n=1 Tax=Desulfosporosinus shakirovi TaxID=2885154 RepID=UPI001E49BD58|nr:4'-phosphopantetheinyl transferase superfamily protein [Desulfosporosinus sp. SRJS8]MCB8816723.1 4'-phosphopantetheinyl transferase superfamily protein [Desulfosporosinus sp. SRJS8]